MTDLELTKLAAEAVGYEVMRVIIKTVYINELGGVIWSPLTDPAQAFELQEMLRMDVTCLPSGIFECSVYIWEKDGSDIINVIDCTQSTDLKRAIVECAARYALWKREQK